MAALEEGGASGGAGEGPPPAPRKEQKATKSTKVAWSAHEDGLLRELVREHGDSRWGLIAGKLGGRSARSCQNRWARIRRNRNTLPLFPLTLGFEDQSPRQAPPLVVFREDDDDIPRHRRGSGDAPECLVLFPLAPSLDVVRDNAASTTSTAMDVDSEEVRLLTELRLAPPAMNVVFDARPLQALPMNLPKYNITATPLEDSGVLRF
uniref:Uncharacterized protein n=1 Tax=Oryza brachyantha TaxID=4533 RepID=J3M6M7_ORYBR